MNRRDLIKIGASLAAFPTAIPAAWAAQAGKADWRPAVFDSHENETVIALTELIIPATDTPGAKAARVNRYIDLFLRDGNPAQRARFLDGLHWLDGQMIAAHGHPFVKCTAQQQTALLQSMNEATEGPGRDFFRLAKSLTQQIYYNTEIGVQELNKGGRVPKTLGCSHGSHA